MDELQRLDLTVDGADELDAALQLIKGGGGALLREKIVAAASDKMIVIADDSKLVDTLGAFDLPVEVNMFAHGATAAAIADVLATTGHQGEVKLRGGAADPFITDGGHYIYDCALGAFQMRRHWRRRCWPCPVLLNMVCFWGMPQRPCWPGLTV